MWGKFIAIIIALTVLIFSVSYVYQLVPGNPIKLYTSTPIGETESIIDYGATPMFSENLRFNHNNITFSIDKSCSLKRNLAMRGALEIFATEMKIITFSETTPDKSDIKIGCSNDFIKLGENLFAAGEGGPSRIINTSGFKLIEEGKILLYEDPRCDYPVVEIHELLHVFGFDHTPNKKSIMYNTSSCDQRITPDMIEIINELYSIEPLPDARISELTAIRKGRYLDFNITVLNEGLIDIQKISLTISSEGETIETIDLEEINVGYGRTIKASNVKLPSSNLQTIDFIVDQENNIKEFDEDNNEIKMTVPSQ